MSKIKLRPLSKKLIDSSRLVSYRYSNVRGWSWAIEVPGGRWIVRDPDAAYAADAGTWREAVAIVSALCYPAPAPVERARVSEAEVQDRIEVWADVFRIAPETKHRDT